MKNFRCLGCGMSTTHRRDCYAKRFDLGGRMPATLLTAEATERHNRNEFERQGRLHGYQLVRTSAARPGQRTLTVAPMSFAAQTNDSSKTLAEAIILASKENFSLPEDAIREIAASLTQPSIEWIREAVVKGLPVPQRTNNENEPVFTFTRHELASLLDGSVRFAMFERGLEDWYAQQRGSGCFDVRLEDYAFRCETYRRSMASTVAPNQPTMRSVPMDATPRILRLKIDDMPTVAVWDHNDEVNALTEFERDVGAGLRVKRCGKCIDIIGCPSETSTVLLEFGDKEVLMSIAPSYAVIGESYRLSDVGLGSAAQHKHEEHSWQLQFMANEAPARFEIRYNTNYFIVLLTEDGPIVNWRKNSAK